MEHLPGEVIPVDLALMSDQPLEPIQPAVARRRILTGWNFQWPERHRSDPTGHLLLLRQGSQRSKCRRRGGDYLNQGNSPTRMGLIVANASALPDGSPSNLTIPVVGGSFANGVVLSQAGSQAFIDVDPPVQMTQYNVLAELPGSSDDNVVMVGAHLDSVQRGPGIQDNGSGSAAILETAVQMGKIKPRNTVRFAWWGAEESGLLGSTAYVNGLTQEEQDDIALYLNFDMIGSPNHVFFIYDGDDSDGVGAGPGPGGSAQMRRCLSHIYYGEGLPFKGTDFPGARITVPSSP